MNGSGSTSTNGGSNSGGGGEKTKNASGAHLTSSHDMHRLERPVKNNDAQQ